MSTEERVFVAFNVIGAAMKPQPQPHTDQYWQLGGTVAWNDERWAKVSFDGPTFGNGVMVRRASVDEAFGDDAVLSVHGGGLELIAVRPKGAQG